MATLARPADVLAAGGRAAPRSRRPIACPTISGHGRAICRPRPGTTVDYEFVAAFLWDFCQAQRRPQDRLRPLEYAAPEAVARRPASARTQLDGDEAIFEPFGQGFQSMSPALRGLEAALLNGRDRARRPSGADDVRRERDGVRRTRRATASWPRSSRHGRIDGMVALAMAMSVAGTWEATPTADVMAMIA